ncbi:MAG: helix-turn-helix transcriptional regulator [Spirochaetes bacterium]|nr:helix-turn-helix transcriptional regulator [Spirochaetota bacterium]MBN2769678.1 helix-turn-helix transcriptional regulator [Spirochaetota bacterium]
MISAQKEYINGKETKDHEFEIIQKLVGNASIEQLKNVDYAVIDNFGIFVPSIGPCLYSISPAHTHPSYMIIFNMFNYCNVKMNDQILSVSPYTVSVFSPGIEHQEIIDEDYNRYYAIMIEKTLFEKYVINFTNTCPAFPGKSFKPDDNYKFYINEFICEYSKSVRNMQQLHLIAERISYLTVSGLFDQKTNQSSEFYQSGMDNAIEFMYHNYRENITVDDISSFCGFSSSYFSRLFKSHTGLSPMTYLKQIRLKKARKLLIGTDKTITEIAFLCGFNSSAYFTAAFSEEFKMSPTSLRRNH